MKISTATSSAAILDALVIRKQLILSLDRQLTILGRLAFGALAMGHLWPSWLDHLGKVLRAP